MSDLDKKTTPLGYKTLAAELHELWKVERPRVTQEVSVAGGVSGSAGVDAAGSAPADSPSASDVEIFDANFRCHVTLAPQALVDGVSVASAERGFCVFAQEIQSHFMTSLT